MKRYLAELVGTFALVFCGTGAIVINEVSGGAISHLGIAISFGAVVLIMIYTFGSVSGPHINPAVTVAFCAARLFSVREALPYIISQIAGALLASVSLHLLFPTNELLGTTQPSGSEMQSFAMETILSFLLMLVILGVSQGKEQTKPFTAIAVGTTVMLEALFAGPVCGASMNPARSLAPAFVSSHVAHLWLYLVAPVLGMLVAVVFWAKVLREKT